MYSTTRRSIVLSFLVFVLAAAPVLAHNKLEKAEPSDKATLRTPPPHVQIWFSQEPDQAVSTIELVGPAGTVELGAAHLMDGKSLMAVVKGSMADGDYTIHWQTAGDDGHVQKGELTFTLKRAE